MQWVIAFALLVLLYQIQRTLSKILEQWIAANQKLKEADAYLCRIDANTTYLRYQYNEDHPKLYDDE